MARKNRVTPWGGLMAVSERGLWMGNRGCLHDAEGQITGRRWTTLAWVTCLLEFKGRQRPLMQPGRYTELFFLDEPTALAAGHRPCGECRRADYLAFREAWRVAHRGAAPDEQPQTSAQDSLRALDQQLHAERTLRMNGLAEWQVPLDGLPNGTIVTLAGGTGLDGHPSHDSATQPFLVLGRNLFPWHPGGYAHPCKGLLAPPFG